MHSPSESVRRSTQSIPDNPNEGAMLEMLAQVESLEERYGIMTEAQNRKEKIEHRKEIVLRYGVLLPLSVASAYYLVQGLLEGRIKNYLFDIDRYGLPEYSYIDWASEPYLFGIVVAIYSLLWFVLLCGTFNIYYIGRCAARNRLTREEFDRRLNEEMTKDLTFQRLDKGVGYERAVHPVVFFAVVGSFAAFMVYAGFFK